MMKLLHPQTNRQFPIDTLGADGTRQRKIAVKSGQDGQGRNICIDSDGLAYVVPSQGSRLTLIRCPEFDEPKDGPTNQFVRSLDGKRLDRL